MKPNLKITAIFILVGLFYFAAFCCAEELAQAVIPSEIIVPQQRITSLAEGIYAKVSLDLRDIDVRDALKYFSLKTGLNIVNTKNVLGRVTLIVDAVLAKDVFDIMLRSNGLAYDKTGDIYNVMTEAEYTVLYGKKFADVRQVKIFRLKYALPDQVFNLLDAMKSSVGRILVDVESGSVLCLDSPENIEQMEAALKEFEKKNMVRVFTLNYARAKSVEEQLKSRLDDKKVGSIKADVRANQVIVQTYPQRMLEIAELIEALDKKTKEVLIDTKILKININDTQDRGVEWEGLFDAGGSNGLTYLGSYPFSAVQATSDAWASRKTTLDSVGYVGSYPFSGTSNNYSASKPTIGLDKLHVGVVGSSDFDVLLKYLTTEVRAKILSNPKIVAISEKEALIHVGERQVYVTTTTTTGQSTSTVSESVNFIDLGVKMTVTPTINDDGFVDMKLKAEISSVIDWLVTPSSNRIPIVDTSLAETAVLVKAGATVVIGGLRRKEKSRSGSRVPVLSKIPILGFLFQSRQDRESNTELMIMITPTIISGEALVIEEGKEIGVPEIKSAREYEDLERKKEELKTHMPSSQEYGGMKLKGFRVFKEPNRTEYKNEFKK
ncbi:MAG: secretin N-terminal domain-containing protein [Candidatus Omnitrophota bacterium]